MNKPRLQFVAAIATVMLPVLLAAWLSHREQASFQHASVGLRLSATPEGLRTDACIAYNSRGNAIIWKPRHENGGWTCYSADMPKEYR